METISRWFVLLVILSLISLFLFPSTSYADTSWLKFCKKDALLNTYMRAYAVDREKLWVGTYGDGVVVYTGQATRNYNIKNTCSSPGVYDGLVSDLVTCIAIDDREGRVWIGTQQGLSSCSLNGQNWKRITSADGLPNDVIRDIAVDGKGSVWVGTPSGVVRIQGESVKTYNSGNGLEDQNIQSITVQGDTVWAATSAGVVARFSGDSWQTFLKHP